jgi:hypothetical protein
MSNFVACKTESDEIVHVNLDQVLTITKHTRAAGSVVTLANGESLVVLTPVKELTNHR